MKNSARIDTKLETMVELINESEASEVFGVAVASEVANPAVTYVKFTLTDNKRNANRQRIPDSEFQNLVRTGIFMPIKMAEGEISPGHKFTKPLGVMTHLKEVVNEFGNKAIIALAALWSEERPEDIQLLKTRFAEKKPIDVSWEVLYSDAEYNPEFDSTDLLGTVLKAATIVGNPAYQGRTQFLSVAAKKWSKAYIDELPKGHFLVPDYNGKNHLPIMDSDGKLDRAKLKEALEGLGALDLPTKLLQEKKATVMSFLERFDAGASIDEVSKDFYYAPAEIVEDTTLNEIDELKAKLGELEAKLTEALDAANAKEIAFAEKQTAVSELEAKVAELTEKVSANEAELLPLRELKASIDAKAEYEAKLSDLKAKFTEAGIERDETYFAENAEKLFALDEASLSFMLGELKTIPAAKSDESHASTNIPAFTNEENSQDFSDPKELGRLLRSSKAKK